MNISDLALDSGVFEEATQHVQAAITIFEQLGDQPQIAVAQTRLGTIALRAGDRAAALGHYRQSLMLAHAIGFQPGIVESLEGMAACSLAKQPLLAAKLLAASAALRATIQLPVAFLEMRHHTQLIEATRHASDSVHWAATWQAGQSLSVAQAVALALAKVTAGLDELIDIMYH
ncbi:tetratricopeptide repeat protein [Candidatus Gracilibacteria bacterium]|nr:tetratricopeptide repeat protein [Candidatus Gracilibacteria bacterium]